MYMTINEDKIYFNQLGNPESIKTILYIHGSTMCGKKMEGLVNLLPEFNNITIDLPGHVHSEGEPLGTTEELADFMIGAIRELKRLGKITDDLTVAGYSLGGCITLELALRKIPEIKRIAVLNSCDIANTPASKELYAPSFEEYDQTKLLKLAIGRNTKPMQPSTKVDVYKASDYACYKDVMAGISYQMKDFENIEIPTLFIVGGEDKIASPKNVVELSQKIPNADVSIIPYHGHLSLLERPDIYAQNIRDLIRHSA